MDESNVKANPVYGVADNSYKSKHTYDNDILMDSKAREMYKKLQDIESMKKGNTMYPQDMSKRQYRDVVRDMSEFSRFKQDLEEKIEAYQRQLDATNTLQEKVEQLPFKIGDAVFVKQLGNVIINGVTIDTSNNNEFYFEVVGQKGKDYVKAVDVLPINETTKVLYGK